jgi:penicillin-binding protein 1B
MAVTVTRRPRRAKRRWLKLAVALLLGPLLVLGAIFLLLYRSVAVEVDARLAGLHERVAPRVYARPFVLRIGQALTAAELDDRLDDLGYTRKPRAIEAGEFDITAAEIRLVPRGGTAGGQVVRVSLTLDAGGRTGQVSALEVQGTGKVPHVQIEAPLLTAVAPGGRGRQRQLPLAQLPRAVVQAVLAIEDRRFYSHPGVDIIRTLGAIVTNVRGDKPYLVGGSTLTQQLVKNSFLTPEKTYTRKLREQVMSIVLEQRLTKDQILELYLNDVYLGQRGSFSVHGVAEGAHLFFGKDVSNVSLAEAAMIAGIIQSPAAYSPTRHPVRARERRDVVLRAMVDAGYVTREASDEAIRDPLETAQGTVDAEAPYFVDYVTQLVGEQVAMRASATRVAVHTTLDLHLQRLAQDVVAKGVAEIEARFAKRNQKRGPLQAALVAVDPRSGEILAMVGGRSYQRSQYNRATSAKRQPGSTFKPFVFLSAFDLALREGRTDLTPATVLSDEAATFIVNGQEWSPRNYDGEHDGDITARRALARSRNLATIQMAELTGYQHIASLWRSVKTGFTARAYPSIALGVFEATPLDMAEAYTLFPNLGEVRPLRAISRIEVDDGVAPLPEMGRVRQVAQPAPTFLVTNMMRSVINEGTGAAARGLGFTLDAAGKSGTTNDLRDAWFVGFTPELLTVVWVGLDDNTPVGLTGSQAALPIWTAFMKRALAGHRNQAFAVPDGVTFVEIDKETGGRAGPFCEKPFNEAFLVGTEPQTLCYTHLGVPGGSLTAMPQFEVPPSPPPATPPVPH